MRSLTATTLAILVVVTAGATDAVGSSDGLAPPLGGHASAIGASLREMGDRTPDRWPETEVLGSWSGLRGGQRDEDLDTLWIFDADFSDLTGDNAGWTSLDMSGTLGQQNYWHKDTIRINDFEWPEDSTWWCGTYNACWRQPRGYGNNWRQHLWQDFTLSSWSAPGDTVVLAFDQRYAMERFYDYGYVDVSTDGGSSWSTLISYTNVGFQGAGRPVDWDDPLGHQELDASTFAGTDVTLRYRFESDVAYSSEDQYDNPQHSVKDGAWQLDNIEWRVNSAQMWLDDCESPGENGWVHPDIPATGQTGVTFFRGQYGIDFWTGRGFDCDAPPVGTWMYAAVDTVTSTMVDAQRCYLVSPWIDIDGADKLIGQWHMWVDMKYSTHDLFAVEVVSGDAQECLWEGYWNPEPNACYGGPFWIAVDDDWDAYAGNPWLGVRWLAFNRWPPEPGSEHKAGIFLNWFRVGTPVGDPGTYWERDTWYQFHDWFDHELAEALVDSARVKIRDDDGITWANLLASNDDGATWDVYACRREPDWSNWWVTPPPANQMVPGSEIHYYWEAMDGAGNLSTFPADAPSATREMSILPIEGSIEDPSILLVDKVGGLVPGEDRQFRHSSEYYLREALEILGFEFDVYDVEVPQAFFWWSHGPDAAGMEYYDTQVWFTGDADNNLICTQDQVHLIDWLAESQGGAERNLLVMGNDLGRYLIEAENETLDFYTSWLASDYAQDTVGAVIVDSVPTLRDASGGFDFMTAGDGQCFLAGGCPELMRFDVVQPTWVAGSELVAEYERLDMSTLPAGVAYTAPGMGYQTVNLGFGIEFMMSDDVVVPGGVFQSGVADRADLIGNIMEYFGKEPSGTPTSAPGSPALVTRLGRAYPNPFNPVTTIEYSVATDTRVAIRVYSLAGRTVATVVDGPVEAGEHVVVWDGTTDSGERAASGVYFIQMETDGYRATGKTVLLK